MPKNQIPVEEFTSPSAHRVPSHFPLSDVWHLMSSEGIRHVLVQDEAEQVVGILSQRDLTTFSQASDFSQLRAQDVMTTDLLMVTPGEPIYQVALKMSEQKVGSAVVYDPENQEYGIFTATDALNALVEILRGDHDLDQ